MKTRFTNAQIIEMIKEQEAVEKTADVCRRYGSAKAPSTNTRANMAGCELKNVVTPDAKRKAVAYLLEVDQVSQSRVYSASDVDWSILGQTCLQNAETATFGQWDNASAAASTYFAHRHRPAPATSALRGFPTRATRTKKPKPRTQARIRKSSSIRICGDLHEGAPCRFQ